MSWGLHHLVTRRLTVQSLSAGLQLRASPQTVRLAVRTASPGADAANVLVTVPQPMPGKQVPGGAGETVGSAVGATIAGAELVAGDQ